MRAKGTSGAPPPGPIDREVWRHSQEIEAPADEAERLLDLAAFADNRLEEDDAARVAALLANDPDAANDVAAARLLADATMGAADPRIIARASLLASDEEGGAQIIAFTGLRRPAPRPWFSAASWSGLAAAVVLAGWLGFNLGSGITASPVFSRPNDDASASELLDPSPMLRDFTENSQI